MEKENFISMAAANCEKAMIVLTRSGIRELWENEGCRVNIIGSLRMGLLANHKDIDIHVYSSNITEASTFAIAAKMSALPGVTEITSINGLHTDEHCMAWHINYKTNDGEIWKFDIIHIESGSQYDGYFEHMAQKISEVMTPEQRETILRLKFETPESEIIHGVEYYEAVIADGITRLDDLREWVKSHRAKPQYYWIP